MELLAAYPILAAMLALGVLGGLFGLMLGFAAIRFHVESDPVVDQIDAILPQTQCGQCGFPGCRPYAEAIAAGDGGHQPVPARGRGRHPRPGRPAGP
jgi:Na+-translocating ferredoxin:NAD+ oxidoreductase subunit B